MTTWDWYDGLDDMEAIRSRIEAMKKKSTKKTKREVAKGVDVLVITTPDSREFVLMPEFENCLIEFCRTFSATSKITKLDKDATPLSLDEFAEAVSCDGSEKIEVTAVDVAGKISGTKIKPKLDDLSWKDAATAAARKIQLAKNPTGESPTVHGRPSRR